MTLKIDYFVFFNKTICVKIKNGCQSAPINNYFLKIRLHHARHSTAHWHSACILFFNINKGTLGGKDHSRY